MEPTKLTRCTSLDTTERVGANTGGPNPLAPVPGYHAALPGFFRLPLARGNKVGAEAKHLTQPERVRNKPSFGHKKLSEGVLL